MTDKKELITIAMNLVRDHYDGNETQFGSSCSELEEWCYDHGKEGCAEYVMAQRSPAMSFVPMELRVEE